MTHPTTPIDAQLQPSANPSGPSPVRAALILAGGQSRRMGRDKCWLPCGEEVLLQRMVRTVALAVPPGQIRVIAAAQQPLPPLPLLVQILRDEEFNAGPLAGIHRGLVHVRQNSGPASAVFVTACDTPELQSEVIGFLFRNLARHEAVVIRSQHFSYPLCAVYRAHLADTAAGLLASGERRARALADHCDCLWVSLEQLAAVDPQRMSLNNLNSAQDYRAFLSRLALPPKSD